MFRRRNQRVGGLTDVQPTVLPPLCRYNDCYIPREVPYIQPLINVTRQHIVNVPRTYYEQIDQTVVVPPSPAGQNINPYTNPQF